MKRKSPIKIVRILKPSQKEKSKLWKFYNRIFWDSPWSSERFSQYFSRDSIFITLLINGKAEGIICGKKDFKNKKLFVISALAVSPDRRGKNYGDLLIGEMLKKIKKFSSVEKAILHFRQSKNLKNYYKRFGFKNMKIVGKYKNGEKKYEMEMSLR